MLLGIIILSLLGIYLIFKGIKSQKEINERKKSMLTETLLVELKEVDGDIEIKSIGYPSYGTKYTKYPIRIGEWGKHLDIGFSLINGEKVMTVVSTQKYQYLKKGLVINFNFVGDNVQLVVDKSPVGLPKIGKSLKEVSYQFTLTDDIVDKFKNLNINSVVITKPGDIKQVSGSPSYKVNGYVNSVDNLISYVTKEVYK